MCKQCALLANTSLTLRKRPVKSAQKAFTVLKTQLLTLMKRHQEVQPHSLIRQHQRRTVQTELILVHWASIVQKAAILPQTVESISTCRSCQPSPSSTASPVLLASAAIQRQPGIGQVQPTLTCQIAQLDSTVQLAQIRHLLALRVTSAQKALLHKLLVKLVNITTALGKA